MPFARATYSAREPRCECRVGYDPRFTQAWNTSTASGRARGPFDSMTKAQDAPQPWPSRDFALSLLCQSQPR